MPATLSVNERPVGSARFFWTFGSGSRHLELRCDPRYYTLGSTPSVSSRRASSHPPLV